MEAGLLVKKFVLIHILRDSNLAGTCGVMACQEQVSRLILRPR